LISLPFILCVCVFISLCDDRVFDTGSDATTDGSVEDHLSEWCW